MFAFSIKVLIPSLSAFCLLGCASSNISYEKQAEEIHKKFLTLDSHTDTPLRFIGGKFDLSIENDSRKGGGKVDFARMKKGGLDAVFFAAFISQGERTEEANLKAKEKVLKIIELIKENAAKNSDIAGIALAPQDAYDLKKENKRAVFIGIENGYAIGRDISMIKTYYDLGVRYMTVCHSENNDLCDSSTDPNGEEHNGLSELGKEAVKEMNKLGMMIDISHLSDKSVSDILDISTAPVIASHSNARGLHNIPRNINDELLKRIADKGGVVQICLLGMYIKELPFNFKRDSALKAWRTKYNDFHDLTPELEKLAKEDKDILDQTHPRFLASVSDAVNHIDYIVKLVGIDHVGIGSDFDGGAELSDCYDVSEMKNITIELLKRGYTEAEIEKIWSGNFMRVFKQVREAAEKN